MKRTFALFLCLALAGTFVVNVRAQTGPGSALVFDGVNDFANVVLFATNAPTNEITIELWQNVSSVKAQSSFSLAPDSTANRINAHVPWVDGVVYWDFGNIFGAGRLAYTPPNPITSSWQHFAFVASSSGNYMRIYRNGVLEAQKTGMTPYVRGNSDLNIGQVNGGFFGGQIDELRIWNVARSSNEIATNFMRSLTGNEAGLLLYLRCNEGSGTSTADAAALGGNTTAFLSNGVAWAASGASVGGLSVTMADSLLIDTNGNGKVNANDTLRYTVTIQNNGTNTLTNLVLNVPGNSNALLVPGSVKFPPKAIDDGPASNSVPGNAFHVALNTPLNLSAPGLLANDTLGAPAGSIASFGGGSFPGTATTTAAGSSAVGANVGTLTVNANGSVTFTPTSTFNGFATFQYRLTNALGTSVANGTIAVGIRPSATNDSYNVTGNTMLDSSLIPQSVLGNDVGTGLAVASSTAPAHGTISLNAASGHFTYIPAAAYTGADSFTYTITNGFGSATAAVNLTVANRIWYVDNATAPGTEDGRSTSPYRLLATFNAQNDGAAGHPADNDLIFLRQGSSNYVSGIVLRSGQKLIGDHSSGTLAAAFGFALASGSAKSAGVAVPAFTGNYPVITSAGGHGILLNANNTLRGLNVSDTPNGYGFFGTVVGTLTISEIIKSNLGGGINVGTSGALAVNFETIASFGAPVTAISLNNCSGTFSATSSPIDSPAGTAVAIIGGNADITLVGPITKNGAGRIVDIQNRTGGTITLSGNLTNNNPSATGINIANCTGGTVNFSGTSKVLNTGAGTALTLHTNAGASVFFSGGGLDVDTTSGTALSIMGSGTIIVSGTGNTINATTGTAFFNSGLGGSAFIDINAAIANTTGRLVDIQNRVQANTITLSGNLTNGGTGILIQSNTAGSTTFSGVAKVINTGVNTAITVHTNTGTTIIFNNTGLDVDTTSGTGISLVGGAALFQITGGNNFVNTTTGTAFLNSGAGGNASVSINADLTSTAGRVIDIQNRTLGTVDILGNLSNSGGTGMLVQNNSGGIMTLGGTTKTFSTGANTAVNLVNNTGTTINFLNPTVITTTSGTGFNATGGGTVAVQNSFTGSTVSTTTGIGVNIVNTTIGASGVAFRSVSVNGASSGIVLDNTGSSGSFSVVGSGVTSQGGDNSGGTIQSTSGHGISLNNTMSPSFANMNIQNTGGSGINGTSVNNFTFAAGKILNIGNAPGESSISFNGNGALTGNNIAGVLTVVNSVLTNAFDCGIHVENTAGTISDAVITNNFITSASTTNTSKGDGIRLMGTGNASTVGSLTKARIRNNTVRNFPSGAGIQVSYGNTNAAGPLGTCGIPNDSANVVEISGNICRGFSPAVPFAKNAIAFAVSGGNSGQRSRGNFTVANNGTVGNPIGDCFNIAVQVVCLGYATMTATIDNNVVVANNALGSGGIAGGSSFLVNNAETPDLTLTVINNNISQVDGNGILLFARGTTSTTKLGIRNNTVAAPLGGARPGIRVDAGNASSFDDSVCLDISGNVTAGTGHTIAGIGLRKQGTITLTHDFSIEGMAATASPGIEQYVGNGVGGKNPGSENGVGDGSVNGVLLISATSGFSNCSTAP